MWKPVWVYGNLCLIMVRIRNISDKIVEKIKTYIMCSRIFFQKSWLSWDYVENYRRSGQATDKSMANVYCRLNS